MIKELTTESVPIRERLAYWTDIACDVYVQLDCDAPSAEEFSGRLYHDTLGLMDVTRIACTPHSVRRTHRQIAKSTEDCFLVSWQQRGSSVIRQDQRETVLYEGDFCLYDSTRPYELAFAASFEQLILRFPRDLLRERLSAAENLTAIAVSGAKGTGALTSMMLQGLAQQMPTLEAAASPMVSNALLDMLAASFLSVPIPNVVSESTLATFHKQQVRNYVLAHLSDPELTISKIASSVGLSVSYLYQLFQDDPLTIGRLIWTWRLEKCWDALRDPALRNKRVSEIAFSWGFNDAAHFSRSFKERFGVSPRDFRHEAN
ncbi:MAG: hypothetical protein V7642_2668 [Burkholderiales bacterium]|jgi:AraC-like DNA-binding protein